MPRWLLAIPFFALTVTALAVPPNDPTKKPADNTDANQAAGRVQTDPGLKVTLWAAEPQLANPVCIAFDEQGKCYVVETDRYSNGVPDTRSHMHWLDEDIACRTVADRTAMYKKHKYQGFEKFADQVRVLWDSTGSGVANHSEVFSGGYNRPEDGLGAGILARKGNIYFANIPDLYLLKDTKGDNKADVKQSLATGFGIHVQFIGHDLHGLRMGPDGKLYFSIGDRGLNVTTKEGKKLFNPDSGAVLRCDPDGSNLEMVHIGLRNPQELAFDDYGNLFTYDNNSDSGDRARWVQIVEGGDSGWRCGYQYGTLMHHPGVKQGNRGPWNTETIWHVPGPDGTPPAYVVPPLLHFGNGPSGLTHYPGIGLNDQYKDHFFACDFTANPGNSVIWSLAVKPKGASFEVVNLKPFVKNMVPTDCEFGPDSALYWSDWTSGWGKPNKGRIYRLTDPEAQKNPAVAEAKKLIAEGFEKKSIADLAKLLEHPHSQVRFEAQYELAERGEQVRTVQDVLDALSEKATKGPLLARLHAIWALGTLARSDSPKAVETLLTLSKDPAAEVRVQLATVLRTAKVPLSASRKFGGGLAENIAVTLVNLMHDTDARVQAKAAVSFGEFAPAYVSAMLPRKPTTEQMVFNPLFQILQKNDNKDVYLRQAVVEGLTRASNGNYELFDAWTANKAQFNTPAVRLGVVLALRKKQSPKLAEFVNDPDSTVVTEAARAIYDERVEQAMPALAKLAEASNLPVPVAFRALAANFMLGTPDAASRLANFAARSSEPDFLRGTALKLLADWAKPPRRDPITGLTLALPDRPATDSVKALEPVVVKAFAGSDALRAEAVQTVTKLGVPGVGPLMAGLVTDSARPVSVRVDSLFALHALKAKELTDSLAFAVKSPDAKLRAAARVVRARLNPDAAATELPTLLADESASLPEKQMSFAALGALKESKDADAAIADWLDRYLAGKVPPELKLDVLEAAQARATAKNLKLHAPLREKLQAIDQAARAGQRGDPLSRHREVIAGGDADIGRSIFLNNSAVYCQRCHKLDGQGGEVGPPLNGIAAKNPREYLLESILEPSKAIAKGYESVILSLADGRTISGVLRAKDAKGYTVVLADGKVLTIPKDDVDAEKPDKSAMPEDLVKKLSKRELRDLVEFLASLKDEPKK